MIGEFDFDSLFNSGVNVPQVTWFIFIVFLIIMTLLLMNLLVRFLISVSFATFFSFLFFLCQPRLLHSMLNSFVELVRAGFFFCCGCDKICGHLDHNRYYWRVEANHGDNAI